MLRACPSCVVLSYIISLIIIVPVAVCILRFLNWKAYLRGRQGT